MEKFIPQAGALCLRQETNIVAQGASPGDCGMLFINVLERRPAVAFDNADRGAERYAVARSNATD